MRHLEVCLKCIAILFGQGLRTPFCQAGVMKWTPKVRPVADWRDSIEPLLDIYADLCPIADKAAEICCNLVEQRITEISPSAEAWLHPCHALQGNSSEAPIVVAARKVGLSENIAGDLHQKRVADGRDS